MHYLIKLIARAMARRIERGSRPGALAGCLAGLLAGLAGGYALWKADAAGIFGPALMISLTCLGGIGGALFGSMLPARSHPGARDDGFAPVRVTNWNASLGKLAVALICLGLCAAAGVFALREKKLDLSEWWPFPIVVLIGVGALWGFAVSVLWIEIDQEGVVVRRPLGAKLFTAEQIVDWGFETPSGLSRTPPSFTVPFHLQLEGGPQFSVAVSPPAGARLRTALERLPIPVGSRNPSSLA